MRKITRRRQEAAAKGVPAFRWCNMRTTTRRAHEGPDKRGSGAGGPRGGGGNAGRASEQFFVFLDGEHLGQRLLRHFRLPEERGYTDLGRVRVTVERMEADEATEEASPT